MGLGGKEEEEADAAERQAKSVGEGEEAGPPLWFSKKVQNLQKKRQETEMDHESEQETLAKTFFVNCSYFFFFSNKNF